MRANATRSQYAIRNTPTQQTNTTRDSNRPDLSAHRPVMGLTHQHMLKPSSTNVCGSGASTHPSSRCAWPTAWPPSSCRPSWRTPSCATHVSWAPWFQRLETTNERQPLQLQWEKPKIRMFRNHIGTSFETIQARTHQTRH